MLDKTYHTISFLHSSNFCVDGNEKAKEEIRLAYYFEYLNRFRPENINSTSL